MPKTFGGLERHTRYCALRSSDLRTLPTASASKVALSSSFVELAPEEKSACAATNSDFGKSQALEIETSMRHPADPSSNSTLYEGQIFALYFSTYSGAFAGV